MPEGLGILVRCQASGKSVTFRAWDLMSYIAPAAEIETLRWRCTWCQTVSNYVRYVLFDGMGREDLAKWTPPAGMRRRP